VRDTSQSLPAPAGASPVPGPLTMLRGTALDVGLPVLAYYALHLAGASDWAALLAGSAVAATRIAWSAVRQRSLNAFATLMLLVYGVGFALVLTTGDPRTLLLRSSLVTAVVGLVFLITAWRGRRPLTLAASQSFAPGGAEDAAREYETDPRVRHGYRVSSVVWGSGLLVEAVVRVPLVHLLPIDVAVGASEGLLVGALLGLVAWNGRYVRRGRARGRAAATPALG
jgi:hypothetical protein